ncbi:NAD(P)-dependent dehydrogenase (short-subunit alcohol dehydrogenase family) [Planomicrobium soli]|uniref:NAD(P)-dependent dehydrogenase (Short-subunit alcohol dehydrogenase family) n=1 Tax=Planomicrobium soli TaxID=1176648 RepID=A0A2P8H2R9_9BACL|nr:3-hydroxyacyl-CoA dehydrogenase [Planomicrobium soli]PSL40519.1 NAD(P)-dependent dehydrogenase (short-subunit alcohol dehydrogenase family) [Planomicrobium soli]
MKLADMKAIVTGGASGLGEATVRRIVEQGGQVAIFDLNKEKAQKLIEELGEEQVFYIQTDVSDANQVEQNVRQAVERFGSVNAAINCAGIGTPGKVVSKTGPMPLEQFEKVIRINLVGSFNVIRVAAAAMQKNTPNEDGERGIIISTASVAAYEGQIGQAAYSASKGGIVSMTLPIAREFARDGIRVMAIAPGLMKTPMFDGLPEAAVESLSASVPFPARLGKPSEYAQLVESIAENAMLNGEVIRLDGAIRMQPR